MLLPGISRIDALQLTLRPEASFFSFERQERPAPRSSPGSQTFALSGLLHCPSCWEVPMSERDPRRRLLVRIAAVFVGSLLFACQASPPKTDAETSGKTAGPYEERRGDGMGKN